MSMDEIMAELAKLGPREPEPTQPPPGVAHDPAQYGMWLATNNYRAELRKAFSRQE